MTGRNRRPPAGPAAAYAAARARALNPRRGDPHAGMLGGPGVHAAVASMLERCTCGEPKCEHQQARDGTWTYCCTGTAAGVCPCRKFTPVTGGESNDP